MVKQKFSFEAAGFDKQLEALIAFGRGKIESRVSVKTENIKTLFHNCFDQAKATSKFQFELKKDREKALAAFRQALEKEWLSAGGATIEDSLKRQKEIAAAALARYRAAPKAPKAPEALKAPEAALKRPSKKPQAAEAKPPKKRMNIEAEFYLKLQKEAAKPAASPPSKKRLVGKGPPERKKSSGLLSDRGAFKAHLHRERHWFR